LFEPLKRPRKKGHSLKQQPLLDTRTHIFSHITFDCDRDSVSVGMNEDADIGAIHPFGGTTHHAPMGWKQPVQFNQKTGVRRFAKAHKANFIQFVSHNGYDVDIPARPFLPIRNDQVDLPAGWKEKILISFIF